MFGMWQPHVTIEYINKGEKEKYKDLEPKGKWTLNNIWIWGTEEPHMITLE